MGMQKARYSISPDLHRASDFTPTSSRYEAMAMVAESNGQRETVTPRTHYREVVAAVAAKAKEKLPQTVNGRVESAVKLVLSGDVLFAEDGSVEVGSTSDPMKTY